MGSTRVYRIADCANAVLNRPVESNAATSSSRADIYGCLVIGHDDLCRTCIADSSLRTASTGSISGADASSTRSFAFFPVVSRVELSCGVPGNASSRVSGPLEHFEHRQSK